MLSFSKNVQCRIVLRASALLQYGRIPVVLRQLSSLQDKRKLLFAVDRHWTANPQNRGQGYALVLRTLETEEIGQIFQLDTFAQVQGQGRNDDLFHTRTFRKDKGWKGKNWNNEGIDGKVWFFQEIR